jgi:hypothetical protein
MSKKEINSLKNTANQNQYISAISQASLLFPLTVLCHLSPLRRGWSCDSKACWQYRLDIMSFSYLSMAQGYIESILEEMKKVRGRIA